MALHDLAAGFCNWVANGVLDFFHIRVPVRCLPCPKLTWNNNKKELYNPLQQMGRHGISSYFGAAFFLPFPTSEKNCRSKSNRPSGTACTTRTQSFGLQSIWGVGFSVGTLNPKPFLSTMVVGLGVECGDLRPS